MTPVFKKLNFKDQKTIHVLLAPESFVPEMEAMSAFTTVERELKGKEKTGFVLCFCTKQTEVDSLAKRVGTSLEGDGILWVVYPKGTSKKYKCDFNRDNGWAELGKLGFEPVRMIAIDEDWSALRFRRVENIKKMTRSSALTDEGKKRIGKP